MMADPVKRQYDNSLRAEQARDTQRRVLDAAYALLIERGYAATSMNDIARAAGVSRELLYKTFGGKAALVKRVYDVTLVGDEEPIPLAQRPEIQAIAAEPDPFLKIAGYAALGRKLIERLGPLITVLLAGARAGEEDLSTMTATLNQERMIGAGRIVGQLDDAGALRAGLTAARARDLVWTLTAPEVWQLLVGERGWSIAEYEEWLARSIADGILAPEHRPA